jgi:hypothetical protein
MMSECPVIIMHFLDYHDSPCHSRCVQTSGSQICRDGLTRHWQQPVPNVLSTERRDGFQAAFRMLRDALLKGDEGSSLVREQGRLDSEKCGDAPWGAISKQSNRSSNRVHSDW